MKMLTYLLYAHSLLLTADVSSGFISGEITTMNGNKKIDIVADSSKPSLQMKRLTKSEMSDLVSVLGLEQPQPSKKKRHQSDKRNTSSTQLSKGQHNSHNTSIEQPIHSSSIRGSRTDVSITGKSIQFESNGLCTVPKITLQTQLDYTRKGHAVLRSFLPANIIESLRSELLPYIESHELDAWRQKVEVQLADSSEPYYKQNARAIAQSYQTIADCEDLLDSLGLDRTDLPFMQHFNIWRNTDANAPFVRELCLSPYMAQAASILLDCSTVRLYQDSVFHKRPGDGWTPYHSDCRMAPFDTSKMITFWIGLQQIPHPDAGGTGLLFVDGSHNDFALPYWNGVNGREYERLDNRYENDVSHHMPLEIGDVTVHNGWTLHCAGAADSMNDDRYAIALTYVDGRAEIRDAVLSREESSTIVEGDKEDVWSFQSWVSEVKPRSKFRHSSVPIVWPDKR